jgi:hypothetical protein
MRKASLLLRPEGFSGFHRKGSTPFTIVIYIIIYYSYGHLSVISTITKPHL